MRAGRVASGTFRRFRAILLNGEIYSGSGARYGAGDGGSVRLDGDGTRVGGGELESVEKDRGAFAGDAIAGEGGDEKRDGDLDGLEIL